MFRCTYGKGKERVSEAMKPNCAGEKAVGEADFRMSHLSKASYNKDHDSNASECLPSNERAWDDIL